MCAATLKEHQHGKSRVRLGRIWREGNIHHFVEWKVATLLESDMAHAFLEGNNADMTATDTQKNTVRGVERGPGCLPCLPTPLLATQSPVGSSRGFILRPGVLVHHYRCTTLQSSAARAAAQRSMPSHSRAILWRPTPRYSLLGRQILPLVQMHQPYGPLLQESFLVWARSLHAWSAYMLVNGFACIQ